eukprot:scpid80132/ scgid28826/ 
MLENKDATYDRSLLFVNLEQRVMVHGAEEVLASHYVRKGLMDVILDLLRNQPFILLNIPLLLDLLNRDNQVIFDNRLLALWQVYSSQRGCLDGSIEVTLVQIRVLLEDWARSKSCKLENTPQGVQTVKCVDVEENARVVGNRGFLLDNGLHSVIHCLLHRKLFYVLAEFEDIV